MLLPVSHWLGWKMKAPANYVIHKAGMLLCLAFWLTGCDSSTPHGSTGSSSNELPSSSNQAAMDRGSAPDELVDHTRLRAWIRQHPGTITVVDFWATWCGPCVEKFPKIVALEADGELQDVRFVYVCMDDPEDRETIHNFVRSHGATGSSFVRKQKVIEAFEDFDLISLPTYRIYDRSGEILKSWHGDKSLEGLLDELNRYRSQKSQNGIGISNAENPQQN